MCGRYTVIKLDDLPARFAAKNKFNEVKPNYNVAPGQTMPIVVDTNGQNEFKLMKWGLVPSWAKEVKVGYKMINARAEGIETKPSFRHAYKSQRCLEARGWRWFLWRTPRRPLLRLTWTRARIKTF